MAATLAYSDTNDRSLKFNNTFAQHGMNKSDVVIQNRNAKIDQTEEKTIGREMYDTLNEKHRLIADEILRVSGLTPSKIDRNCFFLDGSPKNMRNQY